MNKQTAIAFGLGASIGVICGVQLGMKSFAHSLKKYMGSDECRNKMADKIGEVIDELGFTLSEKGDANE